MDSLRNESSISEESALGLRLLEAEAGLNHLKVVLSELPDPSGDLVSRCEDLESDICSLRISLTVAPHKKLPPELLAEIFLFCSTSPAVLPPKADDPLLALGQVCRAWRELALQVPELWATISVSFTEGANVQRATDIAEQWISRAGTSCPLSITAECTGPYATVACENPDLVSGFVPLVVSHSHRLRHLDIALPFASLAPLFALPRGAFPCLETLALRPLLVLSDMVTPETGSAAWHWPSTSVAFQSVPLLGEVTYNPLPLYKLAELEALSEDVMDRVMTTADVAAHPFFAPPVSLPWAQLGHISFPFTALTADEWCAVLRECPTLSHLEVAIRPLPSQVASEPHSAEHIHLDRLHHLSVSAFSGGGDELLDRLVTPRLTLFVLMGTQFPPASLIAFHVRSGFVLETFIPVVQIPAEDVERLFQHLCDLKTLVILAISTEHFPAAFWERVGRAELLPHLEALLVRPTAEQAPLLVDMIDTRWGAQAEGFAVGFCDVRPAHLEAVNDELRRLEKYAAGGRTVDVLTVC
ncbi:hypothetical protein DFH07DRAFT_852755 [Mycena maculata]|uniref:F-box domain-containing protein n=1 Tax=Mycena maculata TaxID=230809 RepID=A0AAD7HR99_9AGAR|nr:hypothetical protein DFH07DRAFT_852755 [Mycena maculata]